jgi:RNA polymerase sigma factor (sigma-70 family)
VADDWMTEAFEESRSRLQALAYRMLGSATEADDVVQETWLRLSRSDPATIDNFAGWLTTVVSRICLDVLRSRRSRPSEYLEAELSDVVSETGTNEPDHDLVLAESIGPALMVVLDRLTPAERLAFVLHDLFAVPFDEIGIIVGRSPAAARQLASRARRRVQGSDIDGESVVGRSTDATDRRQREIVDAFLAAARGGHFERLLSTLDPDVVLRADRVAVGMAKRRAEAGAAPLQDEISGADAVARVFAGRAAAAQPALVDGWPGAVWAIGGRAMAVFDFVTEGDRIVAIEIVADQRRIKELALTF